MSITRVEFLDDGYVTATRQITAMDEVSITIFTILLRNECLRGGREEIKSVAITGFVKII